MPVVAQTVSTSTADEDTSVASNVRALLARRRESGRDLATALGWSERTFRRRLAGETPFTVDELTALSRHLGVSPADLLPPTSP